MVKSVHFRALHTITPWRKASHNTLEDALYSRSRGAFGLFRDLNRAVDLDKHGEALFVLAWEEGKPNGVLVRPDGRGGMDEAEIPMADVLRFADHGPSAEVLSRYFLSNTSDPETSPSEYRAYWWVNHKQTARVELSEGYIWSPREKKGGVRNQAYINLTLVRPGDVVISYADTLVKAIGVACGGYIDAPKPMGYGAAGETWNETGWQVPITWTHLETPIRPKAHMSQISPLLPDKYSPLQKSGAGNQSTYLARISAELGELLLSLAGESASKVTRLSEAYLTGEKPGRSLERLPAELLRKVSPRHIWQAVQDVLSGVEVPGFGPSTDYDLITEEGDRLPPKAVFGLAATQALGFQVQPKHFTAGVGSASFALLVDAGYLIVPKGEPVPSPDLQISYEDRLWSEGQPKLVTHLRKERGTGLAKAKKDQFRTDHGRLFCERCKLDPATEYGDAGEACIEVHHSKVQVADMGEEHQTRLEDLECLCANCHRVEHRLLKQKQVAASGEAVAAHTAVAE